MIDVHFVDDATVEIGLNDCVYALKTRWAAAANLRSQQKQAETPLQLTAIGAGWSLMTLLDAGG